MKTKYKIDPRAVSRCILTLVILACCVAAQTHAQTTHTLNNEMQLIAKPTSKWGWIEFRTETNIDPLTIFTVHKRAFDLEKEDTMIMYKMQMDRLGNNHYRYTQYYKGIKVEGANYIVHQRPNGKVYEANGKTVKGLDISVTPSITEREALMQLFSKYADESRGAWKDPVREAELKEETGKSDATFYPKGELLIHHIDASSSFDKENFRLSWKFEVRMIPGSDSRTYYIDALTGLLLNSRAIAKMCDGGHVNTIHYGNRSISSNYKSFSHLYELNNDCGAFDIHTKNANFTSHGFTNSDEFNDGDNEGWDGTYITQSGATAHWCATMAANYYKYVQGRDSYDDSNSDIKVIDNYDHGADMNYGDNACWDCESNKLTVGYGDDASSNTDDLAVVDIIGHELTHGVTDFSAGLIYEKESGAMNESISDCLGEAIEHYVFGTQDWIGGGDLGGGRSLSNPSLNNNPKTYLTSSYWVSTAGCTPSVDNDQCGVHTNSSVGNYWFYLLSEGGSGTNANSEAYDVTGIGITKAADIVYLALTEYMDEDDNYPDYREATIRAASELYGSCSDEVIEVGKAWYAVGVASYLTVFDYEVCGSILGFMTNTYRGINSLTSGGSGCSATVLPTFSSVVFAASNYVDLKEDFTGFYSGSHTFTAMTDECSISAYLKTDEAFNQPNEQALTSDQEIMVKLYPNPSQNISTLEVMLDKDSPISIYVQDISGRRLITLANNQVFTKGKNALQVNTEQLPSGIYQCLVVGNGILQQVKLVVQH